MTKFSLIPKAYIIFLVVEMTTKVSHTKKVIVWKQMAIILFLVFFGALLVSEQLCLLLLAMLFGSFPGLRGIESILAHSFCHVPADGLDLSA